MLLGAVADDLTGATDLALMLSREGMKTVQVMGVPDRLDIDADAVVVALKTRTVRAGEAVDASVRAAIYLRAQGAQQLLFKYCSTFDSTDRGNIGPVADALLDLVGEELTIACSAFPAAGRSIYQGHLFVGSQLLSDSPMRDHPLTPMRDSNLVNVLQRQSQHKVGLVPYQQVAQGAAAIESAFAEARRNGVRLLIVDAIRDEDLRAIGRACRELKLITGGSGIAMGLPDNFRAAGAGLARNPPARLTAPPGRSAVLAGSCSKATRGQVATAQAAGMAAFQIDPVAVAEGRITADKLAEWVAGQADTALVYSSAEPEAVADIQRRMGREVSGALVEQLLASVAKRLAAAGFSRFIVAGGETSGAVVEALGAKVLEIGPEIDPGVPWTRSVSGPDLALALKSGNFGGPRFFLDAWSLLDG